jgi:hypothetical protein
MRPRFEFNLYSIDAAQVERGVDTTLALMGSQGWEIRAMCEGPRGGVMLALQRPLDEEPPLPDARVLSETLAAPLTAPATE